MIKMNEVGSTETGLAILAFFVTAFFAIKFLIELFISREGVGIVVRKCKKEEPLPFCEYAKYHYQPIETIAVDCVVIRDLAGVEREYGFSWQFNDVIVEGEEIHFRYWMSQIEEVYVQKKREELMLCET